MGNLVRVEGGGDLLEALIDENSIIVHIFTCSPVNEALKWHLQGSFYYKIDFDLIDDYYT